MTDYDPIKQGLTYPPASKITFQFPARNERGPVTLVWHDGNHRIPTPTGFSKDDKVPGTGAILFGDKGMIVHGSHGAGGCYLTPETLMDQYSGKKAPAREDFASEKPCLGLVGGHSDRPPGRFEFRVWRPSDPIRPAWRHRHSLRRTDPELGCQVWRFTNHKEANACLAPVYRKGWSL